MGSIDTLVAARVTKPAGIAPTEVPVWNGTTWVRSSATPVGYRSIQQRPVMTATLSAAQSIPTGAGTQVIFNTIESVGDPNSVLSLNSGTGAITVSETAWYVVSGFITFTASGGGSSRLVQLFVGGVEVGRGYTPPGLQPVSASVMVLITAGQALTALTFQDAGAALNATVARLSIAQVSR
jgi:hypothetical protein